MVCKATQKFVYPLTRRPHSPDLYEAEEFPTIMTYIDTIKRMGEQEFKENFRLNQPTVLHLIELYAESEHCPTNDHGGRPKIGAETEIYAFLYYMGNSCTFIELGNEFGLRKSSIWRSVIRVSKWLMSMADNFIRWPQGAEVNAAKAKFHNVPGAIGNIH